MPNPTFTGDVYLVALDALTVMVKLEHMPHKETRAHYVRLVSNMEPRVFDQCVDCMVRNFSARVDSDGRSSIIDAMARGRTIILSMELYQPGEHCSRCADHLRFVSFTDRLLGEPR